MNRLYDEYANVINHTIKREIPKIYVSQNSGTLKFYNNEKEAKENADSEEHYYGNIGELDFKESFLPWENEFENITVVEIVDEIKPITTSGYFVSLNNLTEIKNIEKLDTSNVSDMESMFAGCFSLKELDLSRFNFVNMKNSENMFYNVPNTVKIITNNNK